MNHPVDVHPEDLLDREQLGLLSADEQRRLDAHATQCAACALVRSAAVDFAHERAPVAGDESMTERIVAAAMGSPLASFRPPPPPSSGYVSSHPRRKRRAWAVAGVVMFAATGATASFWSVRHVFIQRLLFSPAPGAPTTVGETRGRAAAPSPPPLSPPMPNPIEPPAPAAKEEAPTPTALREAPASARPKPEAEIPAQSADEVLTAANEARRRGDSAQAMKLYRQLQQQFPGSRQETTSRMLLGRLLLDRGEDPSQALSLFTRYLDASPSGTLAEEARLGRAQSLQRLGRPAEERQAWQQLLSAHPNSIHAERAKKRLDELR
jgi:TolA-binding protein